MDSMLNQFEQEWESLRPLVKIINERLGNPISQDYIQKIGANLKSLVRECNDTISLDFLNNQLINIFLDFYQNDAVAFEKEKLDELISSIGRSITLIEELVSIERGYAEIRNLLIESQERLKIQDSKHLYEKKKLSAVKNKVGRRRVINIPQRYCQLIWFLRENKKKDFTAKAIIQELRPVLHCIGITVSCATLENAFSMWTGNEENINSFVNEYICYTENLSEPGLFEDEPT